ncbi:MAG: DUF3473 domain-containing protein [Pirellulales bacterium]|nr:DUF3473 domain-containing protein [Pirellulales bacterium]
MNTSRNVLSVDVEDWFHILDSPAVPNIEQWSTLPLRAQRSMEQVLALLEETGTKATFFWLGWMAERFPALVRRCRDLGHEIASHGYGHVLAYKVGPVAFQRDIVRAKHILEYIIGEEVEGFRAPGFGITKEASWAFDVIKGAGHRYDSSVFPTSRGHGGMVDSPMGPYRIQTRYGVLPEVPMSVIEILGRRWSLFGGGYLRLAPKPLMQWGMSRLHKAGRPLIVYIHPREMDLNHPRLPLSPLRRFKCYVNLKSTRSKLRWLCRNHQFVTMRGLVAEQQLAPAEIAGEAVPEVPVSHREVA